MISKFYIHQISFPKNLNPKNIILMKFGKFLIMLEKLVGNIYARE